MMNPGGTTEASLLLVAVPMFASPHNQSFEAFLFDALVSEPQAITTDEPLHFILPLSVLLSQRHEDYRTRKVLLMLVSLDAAGKPFRHSDTIMKEEILQSDPISNLTSFIVPAIGPARRPPKDEVPLKRNGISRLLRESAR